MDIGNALFNGSHVDTFWGTRKNESVSSNKANNTKDDNKLKDKKDFLEFINQYIEDGIEKVKNGDVEPSYVIGNQSFTVKEWDKLIEKVDKAQEQLRELVEEEIEEAKEKAKEKAADKIKKDRDDMFSFDVDKGDVNNNLAVSCEGANLIEGKRFSANVGAIELKAWAQRNY